MATDGDRVAVELARMRGCVETGFVRVEGQLDVLTDRVGRAQGDLSEVDGRVRLLEERRWPVASIGVLAGAVSAVVAMVPLMIK